MNILIDDLVLFPLYTAGLLNVHVMCRVSELNEADQTMVLTFVHPIACLPGVLTCTDLVELIMYDQRFAHAVVNIQEFHNRSLQLNVNRIRALLRRFCEKAAERYKRRKRAVTTIVPHWLHAAWRPGGPMYRLLKTRTALPSGPLSQNESP